MHGTLNMWPTAEAEERRRRPPLAVTCTFGQKGDSVRRPGLGTAAASRAGGREANQRLHRGRGR